MSSHQTLNGYSYGAQNPATFSDPSGLGLACGQGQYEGCPKNDDNGDGKIDSGNADNTRASNPGTKTGGGTAPTRSSGSTAPASSAGSTGGCYYAMGMNYGCGGPVAGPGDTTNNTRLLAGSYPVSPGMAKNSDPALAKEVLLMLCGWVPFAGVGCDAYDVKRSADEGDAAGIGLGVAGVFPILGDIAKFPKQLKRVDDALDAAGGARKASKLTLADPQSFKGATPEQIEEALEGVERLPAPHATGGGFGIAIPNGRVVFEAGDKDMRDLVHQGPYVKFQVKGKKPERIPLAGNPALDQSKE